MAGANRSTPEPNALRAYRPFGVPMPSAAASFPLKASLSGEPKDRTPFTIAGLWENRHHPQSGVSSSRDRNSLRIGEVFDLL